MNDTTDSGQSWASTLQSIKYHTSSGGFGPGRINHGVDNGDYNGSHSKRTTPKAMKRDTSLEQNEREEQRKERYAFRAEGSLDVSA